MSSATSYLHAARATRKGNRPWRELVDALPADRREVVRDRLQQLVERFIGDAATPFDSHPFPPEARAEIIRLRAEIHERMRGRRSSFTM